MLILSLLTSVLVRDLKGTCQYYQIAGQPDEGQYPGVHRYKLMHYQGFVNLPELPDQLSARSKTLFIHALCIT